MTGRPGSTRQKSRLLELLRRQAWSIACSELAWEASLCERMNDLLGDRVVVHVVGFMRTDSTLRLRNWVDAPERPSDVASQAGLVIDARRHPGIHALIERGTALPVRLSDVVDLPRFRHTDTFRRTHAYPGDTRFASGAALVSTSQELVLFGAHSVRKDFSDDHMEMLVWLQRVLSPALLIRAGLSRLADAVSAPSDDSAGAQPTINQRTPRLRLLPTADGTDEYWPTGREQQVLGLLTLGLTSRQIGRRLGITERTVRKHLESVYRKANLPSRVAAAAWWQRHSG